MNLNRRSMISRCLQAIAISPVVIFATRQVAYAKNIIYKKSDLAVNFASTKAQVKNLKYVKDAKSSKLRATAKKAGLPPAQQNCENCQFYQIPGTLEGGKEKVGKCLMLQMKAVHGTGWCNVWVNKAKK